VKLEKVRKLKVGDIIVGAKQKHPNHLPEGSLWQVIKVAPTSYTGSLPVRCKKLQVSNDITHWREGPGIAHRLPRVGEKVKVVKSGYVSIKAGEIKEVLRINTSESGSGTPLIVLSGGLGTHLELNFRYDEVERVKKVKKNEVK
jgi:hypothetical protein